MIGGPAIMCFVFGVLGEPRPSLQNQSTGTPEAGRLRGPCWAGLISSFLGCLLLGGGQDQEVYNIRPHTSRHTPCGYPAHTHNRGQHIQLTSTKEH